MPHNLTPAMRAAYNRSQLETAVGHPLSGDTQARQELAMERVLEVVRGAVPVNVGFATISGPPCHVCGKPSAAHVRADPWGKSDKMLPVCPEHGPQYRLAAAPAFGGDDGR